MEDERTRIHQWFSRTLFHCFDHHAIGFNPERGRHQPPLTCAIVLGYHVHNLFAGEHQSRVNWGGTNTTTVLHKPKN